MAYAFIGSMGSQSEPAQGITVMRLDGTRSRVTGSTAADASNCMYLAPAADHRVLYATHAVADGQVSAWRIVDRRLTRWGSVQPSGGGVPCHLSVHPGGYVLTANYRTGSVAVHPIGDDGALAEASDVVEHSGSGPRSPRQDGPHPHMAYCDPDPADGRGDVLVADLGSDTVYRYQLDTTGGRMSEVERIAMPPGTGPRHLLVRGRYAYVVGELAATLTVVDLRARPAAVRTTVPTQRQPTTRRNQPSAIAMSPDGATAYVLNRGPDSIATFSVAGPTVRLQAEVSAGGAQPWDAVVVDGYLYVANQMSDAVTVFEIDSGTGVPVPTGHSVPVPRPVCLAPTRR